MDFVIFIRNSIKNYTIEHITLLDILPSRAYNSNHKCGCSSVVERLLPKQNVVGSSPITRSIWCFHHVLTAKNPYMAVNMGSTNSKRPFAITGRVFNIAAVQLNDAWTDFILSRQSTGCHPPTLSGSSPITRSVTQFFYHRLASSLHQPVCFIFQ